MSVNPAGEEPVSTRASVDGLTAFCHAALRAAGADEATASAASRAMVHGSRLGVDSHGVRLLDHYVSVLRGGRVNGSPKIRILDETGAVATLDADHGHGALAAYAGMEHAVGLAGRYGIGAVSIRNSSHFGPAGAYALAAAEAGFIGIAMANSDSFVQLHDGIGRFHGTNPIAAAAPIAGDKPWLLDMATSAITYNKVQLYKSLGAELPEGVAATETGEPTRDANKADALAPVGHMFGFKGAGLAGLIEILGAVVGGMRVAPDILPMGGVDRSTPREMGAFVLALKPDAFVPLETFQRGMVHYLESLRTSPAQPGASVMAPGDREWAEERRRLAYGVPIDPETERAFRLMAEKDGLPLPFIGETGHPA